MRSPLATLLLLATVAVAHAEPAAKTRAHSGDILLRLHPGVWRPLVAAAPSMPGMRIEPETGEVVDPATLSPLGAPPGTHPLADVPVQTRLDGSRFAVLGGRLRSYSVVSIGANGQLFPECVHSEQEAIELVRAKSTPGGR